VQTDHTALASHEVATLLPPMEEADYRELVEDIRAHGLIEPIWLYEGQIVDGRHRYRACLDAGIEPRFRTWDGPGALVDFVLSLNVERRHLTPAQRAAIAVEVLPLYEADAKRRQRELAGVRRAAGAGDLGAIVPQPPQDAATPALRAPKASERAAVKMHVSARYVAATKRIKAEAPAVLEEMRRGVLTVPEGTKLARMSEQSRTALLERLHTGEATSLRKAQDIVSLEFQEARRAIMAEQAMHYVPDPAAPRRTPERVERPLVVALTKVATGYHLQSDDTNLSNALLTTIHDFVTRYPATEWQTVWDHFQEAADVLNQERYEVRLVTGGEAGE